MASIPLAARRSFLLATSAGRVGAVAMAWLPLIGMFVAAALVFTRRPDALLHAQFWGEDGVYYADVYNHGILETLVAPRAGYIQVVPALGAWLAQLVPVHLAPLVTNALAIGFMVLPVGLLLSRRAATLVGDLRARILLAALLIAMPGVSEIHATIINAQWYLPVAAALVLAFEPARGRWGRAGDMAIVALCSCTGVYCLLLAPLAMALGHWRRRAVSRAALVILWSGVALQLFCLAYLSHHPIGDLTVDARSEPDDLQPSVSWLWRILAGRVLFAPLLEDDAATGLVGQSFAPLLLIALVVGGFAYLLWLVGPPLRFFLLFAAGLFVLTLAGTLEPWPVLAMDDHTERYFFIPRLAVVATLVWALAPSHPRAVRAAAAGALVCVVLVAVPRGWSHTRHAPIGWSTQAKAFEAAPEGKRVALPQYPVGWFTRLVKH